MGGLSDWPSQYAPRGDHMRMIWLYWLRLKPTAAFRQIGHDCFCAALPWWWRLTFKLRARYAWRDHRGEWSAMGYFPHEDDRLVVFMCPRGWCRSTRTSYKLVFDDFWADLYLDDYWPPVRFEYASPKYPKALWDYILDDHRRCVSVR